MKHTHLAFNATHTTLATLAGLALTAQTAAADPPEWHWDTGASGTPMITNAIGWKFNVAADGPGLSVGLCHASPPTPAALDFTGAIEGDRAIVNYDNAPMQEGGLLGFMHYYKAASLVLATTATNIGEFAFFACTTLTGTLEIPAGVRHIGEHAFLHTGITELVFAEDSQLKSIGEYAFCNTMKLGMALEIPASVETIGDGAFNGSAITGLAFAPGSAGLPPRICEECMECGGLLPFCPASEECTACESGGKPPHSITPSLQTIGDYAFAYTYGLEASIEIPATVAHLGNGAFSYSSLANVTFMGAYPAAFVGADIYGSTPAVTHIQFEHLATWQDCDDTQTGGITGDLATTGDWMGRPILCLGYAPPVFDWYWTSDNGGMITNALGWKFNVTADGPGLTVGLCHASPPTPAALDFTGAVEGGRTIVNYADAPEWEDGGLLGNHRGKANALVLATTAANIGDFAFFHCPAITGPLEIPAGVARIGEMAFNGSGITALTFAAPSQLGIIGDFAFMYNPKLVAPIEIPASVTDIGEAAFFNSAITGLSFAEDSQIKTIGSMAFSSTATLKATVKIPASVTAINYFAFSGSAITGVEFAGGSQLHTIGREAFATTMNLREITIPATVVKLGAEAFAVSALTNVTFLGAYPATGNDIYWNTPAVTHIQFAHLATWQNCDDTQTGGITGDLATTGTWMGQPIICIGYEDALDIRITAITLANDAVTITADGCDSAKYAYKLIGAPILTSAFTDVPDTPVLTVGDRNAAGELEFVFPQPGYDAFFFRVSTVK